MFYADLHIHSRYSRATSRDCDLPHLDLWARKKGIALVGTGDFTHPAWRQELQEQLLPAEEGLYRLKEAYRLPWDSAWPQGEPRFLVTGEISSIYKQGGKTRKVHNVLLLPSLEAAEKLARRLERIGNLQADGRPMLQVFNTCKHFIRTIPNLVYSESNVEDIDTDQEDHIYDECRYVLMETPLSPPRTEPVQPMPDDPLELGKKARFFRV